MDKRQQRAITNFASDRTPRPLMGPVLAFDLVKEAAQLSSESGCMEHGHNARTLIKHSEFRLVLIVLNAGELIAEQEADERICIHLLTGALRVKAASKPIALAAGGLVAIDRDLSFEIDAVERSEFLLWIGWSSE